jgi:signal transduction histidine kinase
LPNVTQVIHGGVTPTVLAGTGTGAVKRLTLRRRLYSLLARWFLLFLIVSGIVSFLSFSRFRANAVEERLLLARTVAHYLDSTTSAAIQGLGRLASQLPSLDAGAVGQMRSFRFQSLFREAIYLLDRHGNRLVADPASAEPLQLRDLADRETVTSLLEKASGSSRPSVAIIQPFQRDGERYFLVSEMNPLGSMMSTFLQNLGTEPDLHVVVVDVNGKVIAAPDQRQLFRVMPRAKLIGDRITAHRALVFEGVECNVCDKVHEGGGFLTVMAPLRFAPWGVIVQQHKSKAFAALYTSQSGFLAAGALLVLMGVFLSRALLKSVISPIQSLSDQAELLRRGDLSAPITVDGDHEIKVLAVTMDEARQRLSSTLRELQNLNVNLEGQVASRTKVLRTQYENLRLLHDVAQVSTREREPERLIPEILRLVVGHYSFHAAALVTMPLDGHAKVYRFPEDAKLPWLEHGEQAPADWQRWLLEYQGRVQGTLFCPRVGRGNGGVMEALRHQVALSLHGTYLVQRALVQDGQRRVLVRRLLDASEEERKRIARELHDEIAQLLTVIQLSLEDMHDDNAEIRKARELLAETQREVHRIIYDLRPSLLDDLGLSAAIKWYAKNYVSSQGLDVSLEVEDELRPSPEIEIATFRIYQEIITNMLRHAQAENVSVELYSTGDELVLGVEDDGVGFSPEEKYQGAGIVGMRERAALVNGTIRFNSEVGTGTTVTLRIPLRGDNDPHCDC